MVVEPDGGGGEEPALRVAIGQLALDGLAPGEWRALDAAGVAKAFEPPVPGGC